MATGSQVHLGVRKGAVVDLGHGRKVTIEDVNQVDLLYLGTDGKLHMDEVKHTAKALRDKLDETPRQLENLGRWRAKDPGNRVVRVAIDTDERWTELFPTGAMKTMSKAGVPLDIAGRSWSPAKMDEIWAATEAKARQMNMWPPKENYSARCPRSTRPSASWESRSGDRVSRTRVVPEAGAWSSTTPFADGDLPGDAEGLVTLLDRILAALEAVPPPDEREIPRDFLVGWVFTAEWLSEVMPSFCAITREVLARRLGEQVDDPPPALVEAMGRYWIRWLLDSLLWRVLSALDDLAGRGELGGQAARLLEVAGRRIPAARPVAGREVLRTVTASMGRPRPSRCSKGWLPCPPSRRKSANRQNGTNDC